MEEVNDRSTVNKVIIVGDSNVGKSVLLNAMLGVTGLIPPPTVGSSYARITGRLPGEDLNVWDLSGAKMYRQHIPLYAKNAKVAVICFDTPSKSQIKPYLKILKKHCPDAQIVFAATKIDLMEREDYKGRMDLSHYNDIAKYASRHNAPLYYTSARKADEIHYMVSYIRKTATSLPPVDYTVDKDLKTPKKSRLFMCI